MSRQASAKLPLDGTTYLLDVLSESAKAVASEIYEARVGLTLRELRILRVVATDPGMTLSTLITLTRIEKTLASKLVTTLVKKALLQRSIGAEDARRICLDLTEKGAAAVREATRINDVMEEKLRAHLSSEKYDAFRDCLLGLIESNERIMNEVKRHLARE